MIHQRIIELITAVQPRVFNSLAPTKIIELFRLGEGDPPTLGIGTAEVVDGFYSFLGFTRLMSRAVIRKSIARGIEEGHFGYVSGPKPGLSAQGKFEVAPTKVRFKTSVAEDEVDLDTGFLMLPQAIPQPTSPTGGGPTPVGPGGGTPGSGEGVPGGVTPHPWRDWSRAGHRPADPRTREDGPTHVHRRSEYALHSLECDCQPRRPRWRSHGNGTRRVGARIRQEQTSEWSTRAARRGRPDRLALW